MFSYFCSHFDEHFQPQATINMLSTFRWSTLQISLEPISAVSSAMAIIHSRLTWTS